MTFYRGIPLEQIKRLKKPKLLLPNEHGAWVMLLTFFAVGWLAAPRLSLAPLLILPATLGAFLARYPLGIYFKKKRVARALSISLAREIKWFFFYLFLTLICGIPLLYPLGWWWLVPISLFSMGCLALHLWSIIHRKERTLLVELTATFGMSVLLPTASYATVQRWSWTPIVTWAVMAAFATFRITQIRKRLDQRKTVPVDLRAAGKQETYYAIVMALLVILATRIYYLP